MKPLKPFLLLLLPALLISCVSVRVATDYDRQADFDQYRTFAFFKPGIDKAEISDLDKKRILRAIEAKMIYKGYAKSENPDMLISIFTKERERVNVYNNYGFGWGWWGNPYWGWGWGGNFNNVSTRTEGVLYIDIIDAKKKELIWQGKGSGYLLAYRDVAKKEQRIREFVDEILNQYPPGIEEIN
ncbi:DUF4136 domain-containing protein [Leptobacterium sp. I13]|uniref:DUF4136 domain-containing protein n=1 Tax=Leptobacterium meishanense TaxID=3128904 RepID=UPI0030EB759D